MLAIVQTFGWLLCVIYSTISSYWLIIHPYANYWRSRARSPFRVLLPVWIGMWVATAIITSSWRHVILYATWWSWLPAGLLFAIGLWIYRHCGQQFTAQQLGGLPELLPDHRDQRLVTTGIRGRVRHPVYLAHLCEMLGWSIATGLAVGYALTAFAVVTGAIMIRMEEAELEQRFGDAYREYRQNVPAVLPRLMSK